MIIRILCVRALLLSALLMLSSAPGLRKVNAQSCSDTPESIANAYLTAMHENNWDLCGKLMHPEALDKFKNMILPIAIELARSGQGETILTLFGDVNDIEELSQLNSQQFFVKFLKGRFSSKPRMREVSSSADIVVLGHVSEGTEVSHVVYRMRFSVDDIIGTQISVISLQRYRSEWRVLLSGEMEGMAQMLRTLYRR